MACRDFCPLHVGTWAKTGLGEGRRRGGNTRSGKNREWKGGNRMLGRRGDAGGFEGVLRKKIISRMPTARHSDSTPDSRRICLCSRLPCGSYGAGSPTAVVYSRGLASCGNGVTLCRSSVDTCGHVGSVCTLDHFTCAPSSYRAFVGGKA